MSMSQQSLREALRKASDALSRAEAAHLASASIVDNTYASRGISDKQLKQLQQSLLDNARHNLAIVRSAALQTLGAAALPGLPTGRVMNESAPRDAELALASAWRCLAEFETMRHAKAPAIAAYRAVVEIAPGDMQANAQLADLLESTHDLVEARSHAENALAKDSTNFIAARALARTLLRQEKFAEAERAALTATTDTRVGVDDQALAWSLVGEARDRLNQTASAFKAFTRANQLMLGRYGAMQHQSHPANPDNVRTLTRFVERMRPTRTISSTTPSPVFLIGFPRSGTTLIEQVLSAHSQTFCLGETDYLFEAMSVVLRDGDLLARISNLTAAEIETVRKAYRQIVLRDQSEADGRIIVDKHPLHIVLLPLINTFFPDAKIIFTQRDPRDTALSCYQQCFGINVATAQFLDLAHTAEYFDAVMTLMIACREHLALDLHQVNYQDVVRDLESETRHLAAFLGIDFEPAMLRYDAHARTRTIGSASARQVINPIYDRSINRWRRYTRELTPVLPLLNKWARRLGYEE